jgi:hypothetical protein
LTCDCVENKSYLIICGGERRYFTAGNVLGLERKERKEFLGNWYLVKNGNIIGLEDVDSEIEVMMYGTLRCGTLTRAMRVFLFQINAWRSWKQVFDENDERVLLRGWFRKSECVDRWMFAQKIEKFKRTREIWDKKVRLLIKMAWLVHEK